MGTVKHYFQNTQIEEPVNWEDISISIDFEKDSKEPNVSISALEFKGQTAIDIIADMESNGYYEGRAYRVEASDDSGTTPVSVDCYLDYSDNPIKKAPNIVEVAIKRRQGNEWLTEQADKNPFRYLASSDYNGPGKITSSDYFGVPYVINYIPDGMQLLILAISAFTLTKELIESIKSLATQTTNLIEGVTPVVGTSVGAGAGVVTAWSIGKIIGSIINLAVTLAYTIAVIVGIVKLVEQIIEQLAPVKRFHLGMPVKLLVQRGCEALGLTLKSTLLDSIDVSSNKWVLMPSKGHKGGTRPTGAANDWEETGYTTSKDGFDTLADVIRFIKETFKADYRIKNGTIEIERADFWQNQSGYIIPNTFNNQDELRHETSVNTEELKANYVIQWSTDTQDQNTLDNQEGRILQAVTSLKTVTNPDLLNLKGLETVTIPCSMATRKNKLTAVEEALKILLDAADLLSGQLDSPQSFAAKFKRRVGAMSLSNHLTSVPKIVVMDGNSLAENQRELLSASKLWEDFHSIVSFVTTLQGANNQQVIFADQKIPFSFADFVSLANNNFVEIETGEKAEIKLLDWKTEQSYATVTYNVYREYDSTLKLTLLT